MRASHLGTLIWTLIMNLAVRSSTTIAALLLVCTIGGCSTFNVFDQKRPGTISSRNHGHGVQIARGKPRPVVDAVGRLFGTANQLALGNRLVDNHAISPATEHQVVQYLQDQQLNSVLVRVNQYDPLGELKRTFVNRDIRPAWKFSVGSYNWLKYTLLPGRIMGGDWYNPYSQTLNMYSDVAPLAISRAAYAQDIQSRANPGAYAAISEIPGLGLRHETVATQLAIDWYSNKRPEQLAAAKDVLYPNYGASWGGQLGAFIPYGEIPGRIAGGLAGRFANSVRK